MSFSLSDITEIKWSLATLMASIGVVAGLYYFSATYADRALNEQQAAQKLLTNARSQLATALSDLENMANYRVEYQTLEEQKVIGTEQRLDLIEGLENIRKQTQLDFKYNIAPQKSYTPNPPLDAGNFALTISPMTLTIDLLHEEQLLHLFAALHSEIKGWFILDSCSLNMEVSSGKTTGPVKAECSGGWFTMKNRGTP